MAEAISQSPSQQANGIGRSLSPPRGMRMDRQQRADCQETLLANNRRGFPARCKKRCTSAAKSGAAGSRVALEGTAKRARNGGKNAVFARSGEWLRNDAK